MNLHWRRLPLLDDWRAQLGAYEDTLGRLLGSGFDDLTPPERRTRADAVVRLCANTAALLTAAPVPFLEVPVHAAMVHALGKIYGVSGTGRTALLRVAVSMGGGMALRQALRLVPAAGALSVVARVYAATWTLGCAAQLYFERQGKVDRGNLQTTFDESPAGRRSLTLARMDALDLTGRLMRLDDLRRRGLVGDAEYIRLRAHLLDQL